MVVAPLTEPDETVSAAWVQPVVPMAGNADEAAADAESVTAALSTNETQDWWSIPMLSRTRH